VKGKGKGSAWERDICKYLSKWIQGSEKPYLFWRQPLSGGLATISELNKDLSGDIRSISPKSEWWPFSVEAKTGYPKTSFWQHFKDLKHFNIADFWIQCTDDAKKADKYPMLIYRKLRQKPISIQMNWNNLESIVFYSFKDFFNTITPEDIKGISS